MATCVIIPAYDAERSIGSVLLDVASHFRIEDVVVIDDGSRDGTAREARRAGARVLRHERNLGKGNALRTGMRDALQNGYDLAITMDADGQHPASQAKRLWECEPDREALVLGVRSLKKAGAPRANQISNGISNFFLSYFSAIRLRDTQCGLRRYPLQKTLDLLARDNGYAFESEVILRAVASGMRIVEVPVEVIYPPAEERVTHFDSVRDPIRIVARVVKTLASERTGILGRAHLRAALSSLWPEW